MAIPIEAEADAAAIARKLSFSDGDELPTTTLSAPERLRVYVRVRPLSNGQEASEMDVTDSAVSLRTVKSTAQGRDSVEEASYSFDGVFDAKATQEQVFERAMLPQVRSLFMGRDTLTFAYGITNAGKTYTIQGDLGSTEEMGVLPRALESIFQALDAHEARKAGADASAAATALSGPAAQLQLDDSCTYEVRASFLEVYGNDAFDLLALPEGAQKRDSKDVQAPKRVALKLKEDRGQVYVEGLKEVELPDLAAAVRAVQLGWQQRATNSNGLNDVSSRSHAVLCIKLLAYRKDAESDVPPTATRLCVVDLAGAERQKKTLASGARLNEAKSINQDLMVLGHCLRDLRWNQTHAKATQKVPPFRDARITMLFRDYLSGNGQISVIAAVSRRAADATGTLDTLRFAAIAQQIKIVEPPKPALAAKPSVPLPRVAALASRGKGQAAAGAGANAPACAAPALAGQESDAPSDSIRSSGEWAHGLDESAIAALAALREQNAMLQERLLEAQTDRIGLERSIREEVAAEMREHLESAEAEMKERLEMERYTTEDMYLKKLALVRGTTEASANAASVAAHTEILQQTRDQQRREAEHADQLKRLKAELDKAKADLVVANTEATNSASPAAVDELQQALQAEVFQRQKAEEALEGVMVERDELEARVTSAESKLTEERDAKSALQAQVKDLEARLSTVVDISRQSRSSSNLLASAAAYVPGKGKSARNARPAAASAPSSDENAGVSYGSNVDSPQHGLDDVTNHSHVEQPAMDELAEGGATASPKRGMRLSRALGGSRKGSALATNSSTDEVVTAAAAPAAKTSKLKRLPGASMFRSKAKAEVTLATCDEFHDFSNPPVAAAAPSGKTVDPTPIARRTRGSMARNVA